MRSLLVPASLAALVAACTPYIPVKDSFGTSALRPAGSIPPEFAAFNNYDPRVNALLADQLCATPDTLLVTQAAPAAPGEIVGATERCQDYTTGLPEVAPPSAAWPP